MREEPIQDSVLVSCKGLCGAFVAIPLENLKVYLGSMGFKTLGCFAEQFTCAKCKAQFDLLVTVPLVKEEP